MSLACDSDCWDEDGLEVQGEQGDPLRVTQATDAGDLGLGRGEKTCCILDVSKEVSAGFASGLV